MRKNSPRKWLHAILDLLPVLILPIFALAVRSDNNFQPIEVEAQDIEVVNFNQKFNSDFTSSNINVLNTYTFQLDNSNGSTAYFGFAIDVEINHKVILKLKSDVESYRTSSFGFVPYITTTQLYNGYENILTNTTEDNILYFVNGGEPTQTVSTIKVNVIDLTLMFGSGNEPTLTQFNQWYTSDYYEYTTSKKELLNVGTTTLSDTDVGSQMVYTLYNATDKYFNFNNVFNFGQIYDWFVLNIFNGNPSLIFPVVWNIVLYEFIMDLVFLIYALFMFFIDFCTNLIDRFHVKCSGGK